MPQINFRIPDHLLEKLDAQRPEYLDRTGFLCLLIAQAVDKGCTLGVQSAAGTPSSLVTREKKTRRDSSNGLGSLEVSSKLKSKAANAKKRTKTSPEFDAFWKTYQSSPSKANCQSKSKAWEAWTAIVGDVGAERLLEAAGRAVKEVQARQISGEFCAPLPDCFRWLRDERFSVLLEDHVPASGHQTMYL